MLARRGDQAPLLFPHARFYGRPGRTAETDGFALADLALDPTVTVQRHTHETAHFVFLLGGAYVTSARHSPALCTGPTLIYNPPGTTHRDRFHEQTSARDGRFFSLAVSALRYASIADDVRLIDTPIALASPYALGLAFRLVNECRHWDTASPFAAAGLGLELVAEVVRAPHTLHGSSPRWLGLARDMLREMCTRAISMADVARAVGVHPVHLARTFRHFYACSPGDYVRRCRLDHALTRLTASSESLATIALASGFADQSHFIKAFRRAFATTPGAVRRLSHRRDVSS